VLHADSCGWQVGVLSAGLQLLHALRYDEHVVGGESFLIDSFQVAEHLRASEPEAFETLASIPATFLKDHSQREHPVLLSYQRPHFTLEPRHGRLTGVFWSPPFEGPLVGLTPSEVDRYYAAYRVLHEAIESAPRWEHRLRVGEVLIFNNRRMLHGRRAFETHGVEGARHLRGTYVNIDEFANMRNLLRRRFDPSSEFAYGMHLSLGNQDGASGSTISLP
jgi:alpha-ketoglutarate-dependent taurine dioxygenase